MKDKIKVPDTMKAMVLQKLGQPLQEVEMPIPQPEPDQILIKVHSCGVCRTDLHIVDGELANPKLPLIPGHEIVGTIVKKGELVVTFNLGDRVGVPWMGFTCGTCRFCKRGQQNLCDNALFTGYTIDGGFAEYTVANQKFIFRIPDPYNDSNAAPLLCAGLIGYRSFCMCGDDIRRLGIYGFGAAAHIITQIAQFKGSQVYAFTRPGDNEAQDFARSLGAVWAGDSSQLPPEKLDAAIIFAPVGSLLPTALRATVKGGVVVCGGIHMSDIPSFSYDLLWGERKVVSVANLLRKDGEELMEVAPKVPVKTAVTEFPLRKANEALELLRSGEITGAAVLVTE